MNAETFLTISIVLLAAGGIGAVVLYRMPYRKGRVLTSSNCMLAVVFLSSLLLFFPIYAKEFGLDVAGIFKSLLISIHTVMRLFVLDGDFEIILGFQESLSPQVGAAYSAVAAIVYVLGPVLTFGFILSFFKNITAYRDLYMHFMSDLYVFSELNEKSLVLAESIKQRANATSSSLPMCLPRKRRLPSSFRKRRGS